MRSRRKFSWLIIFALVIAGCGGSGADNEDGSEGFDTTQELQDDATSADDSPDSDIGDATSGSEDQAEDDVDTGTAVLDEVGYELQSTGGVEFDHTGDALCIVTQGQLDVEFYPDLGSDLFYRLRAVDFSDDRSNYGVAFLVEGEGGESMGSGFMEASTSDAGDGVLFLSGSFTAVFAGQAGDGSVRGRFGCLIDGLN